MTHRPEDERVRRAVEKLPNPAVEKVGASWITRQVIRFLRIRPDDLRDDPLVRKVAMQPKPDEVRRAFDLTDAMFPPRRQTRRDHRR